MRRTPEQYLNAKLEAGELTVCEGCERYVKKTSPVQVQTIPGSFDTKLVTIKMCAACENEYNDLLKSAWNQDAL